MATFHQPTNGSAQRRDRVAVAPACLSRSLAPDHSLSVPLLRLRLPFCYGFVTGQTSISLAFCRRVTGVTAPEGGKGEVPISILQMLPSHFPCRHVECAKQRQRRRRFGSPDAVYQCQSGVAPRLPPHSICD